MADEPSREKDTASEADIVFCSEVEIEAPEAGEAPLSRPGLAVEPKGDAARDACPLYVALEALQEAVHYARLHPDREVGGFLIGGRFAGNGPETLWIDRFLEARHLKSGPASARFTHATFEDAWRRIEALDPGAFTPRILGWFHTHPGFGAFLSEADRFIHRRFFDLPFLVALVVDPVREELLFFRWREGEIRSTGFFLVKRATA